MDRQAQLDSRRAWVVVAAGFTAMFTSFGIAYSFGAFFGSVAEEFDAGRGATALLFSLTSLLFFVLGGVSGPATDRFGPRRVLLVGAATMAAGLFVAASADSLAVALVAYSLGVGIGVACAYVPMVAVVGGWFERRRTLALGVAVSGIGLGTLVLAPLAAALIEEIGWRDTYRVLAVAGPGVIALSALGAAAPPPQPAGPGPSLREAIRDPGYLMMYASGFLLSVSLFVPFVHLPPYAEEHGISPVAAAGLVGVIGAASIVGRLLLGAIASWTGLVRTYQACFLAMGGSFALWLVGEGYGVLFVFAAVLGTGYGGFVALSPAVVAERFGAGRLGALVGVLYTGAGVGSAIGPPAAGALIDSTGGYSEAIWLSLALGLVSWAVLLPLGRTPRRGAAPARA